jgi:hypothetical protein
VTVRAAGAEQLPAHCLRYDRARRRFFFGWRLTGGRTGRVTLRLEVSYPVADSSLTRITVRP